MSTAELLRDLRRRGVSLAVEGERLVYKAPRGVITDELRHELASQKPKLLLLLRNSVDTPRVCPDDPSKMTLAEFARCGRVIRVRSRLLGEDAWWVSTGTLKARVPDPTLVVYTARELRHLVNISPQDLINIHRIKKTLCGHIEN